MATPTTNYNLLKPSTGETYNVQLLDDNYDKIDAGIHNAMVNLVANNVHAGSNAGLQAGLAAKSIIPIIQAGSVVITTDGNGYGNFQWPQVFPNGVIACVISNGDDLATGKNVSVSMGSASITTSTCFVNAVVTNTGAGWASPFRCDFIAIGW